MRAAAVRRSEATEVAAAAEIAAATETAVPAAETTATEAAAKVAATTAEATAAATESINTRGESRDEGEEMENAFHMNASCMWLMIISCSFRGLHRGRARPRPPELEAS